MESEAAQCGLTLNSDLRSVSVVGFESSGGGSEAPPWNGPGISSSEGIITTTPSIMMNMMTIMIAIY